MEWLPTPLPANDIKEHGRVSSEMEMEFAVGDLIVGRFGNGREFFATIDEILIEYDVMLKPSFGFPLGHGVIFDGMDQPVRRVDGRTFDKT